jgi:ABC-type multidrug transport system ATPase subunit
MVLDFDRVAVRDLTKTFGAVRALNGVDAQFSKGTITAIEGANGSGKSTLLSLLSLLARPTRGQIEFGPYGVEDGAPLRASIGLLGHQAMVYPELNGGENLTFFAGLYQVSSPGARIESLRKRFGLGDFWQRPARTYSRGQLQRVALARAILHEPRLLLLDEPSTGMDDSAIDQLVTALTEERKRGVIIIMATHDHALSERVSDRRLRLHQGRLAGQK